MQCDVIFRVGLCYDAGVLQVPSAHRGFLARAKTVPLQQLQALAAGSGRRLVLCGHSLVSAAAAAAVLLLLLLLLLLSERSARVTPEVCAICSWQRQPVSTRRSAKCDQELLLLLLLLPLLLPLLQGGAVAKLVGLRLLRQAPEWPPPSLRVVCFATPAVGNNALATLVEEAGWGKYFRDVHPARSVLLVCGSGHF